MDNYDVAIIGAGINGCSLAYELHKKGRKVLVLEQEGIASGGSGAAGAFINPKISKSGQLKELIEKAYLYSIDFYAKEFSRYTTSAPLLHIAKYEDDNEKVAYFKEHTSLATAQRPKELDSLLTPYAKAFSSVYLQKSAIVEAQDICKAMLEGVDYFQMKVEDPLYKEGLWHIGSYRAERVVLCTGAYDEIFKEPYMKLRRIYGQRCEIESSTPISVTVHHEVSVSALKKNGRIALGASHYLHEEEMPSKEQGEQELIRLAQKSVELKDVKVHDSFCGMRAGSNDYLPVLGPLIRSDKSLEAGKSALKGDSKAYTEPYPELYMMNGVGGYGFVLAPYLARLICDYFIDKKELPESLEPKRFYYRFAKKEGKK